VQHQRCLRDFIEAQTAYYAQCHQLMSDLHTQLAMLATCYHWLLV